MDENIVTKKKAAFSRNEKMLRFVCYAGVFLCAIIGILLLLLKEIGLGIAVLSTCVASLFLLSRLFISLVRKWVGGFEKKRVILATVYCLIILIPMVTTFVLTSNMAISADEAQVSSQEMVEYEFSLMRNVQVDGTDLLEFYEVNGYYYFAYQSKLVITEYDGAIFTKYPETYVKVNKYSGTCTIITAYEYQRGKL